MRIQRFLILVVSVLFLGASSILGAQTASAAQCDGVTVPCAVGDTGPGGGIVFFVAENPQPWGQNLEMAPQGWNGKLKDPLRSLCPRKERGYYEVLPEPDPTGQANTRRMSKTCGKKSAARLARKYRGGEQKDWYLPSLNEFLLAHDNLGLRAGLSGKWFWTSTQGDYRTYTAYAGTSGGFKEYKDKNHRFRVRPVRAF